MFRAVIFIKSKTTGESFTLRTTPFEEWRKADETAMVVRNSMQGPFYVSGYEIEQHHKSGWYLCNEEPEEEFLDNI